MIGVVFNFLNTDSAGHHLPRFVALRRSPPSESPLSLWRIWSLIVFSIKSSPSSRPISSSSSPFPFGPNRSNEALDLIRCGSGSCRFCWCCCCCCCRCSCCSTEEGSVVISTLRGFTVSLAWEFDEGATDGVTALVDAAQPILSARKGFDVAEGELQAL